MTDTPAPQQYATYPGDVRHMATNRQVVGRNTLGERMVAVTATYDPWAGPEGKTRVGFAYQAEVARLAAAAAAAPQ